MQPGQKFYRLTTVKRVGVTANKAKNVIWKFKCDCGNYTTAILTRVKHGRTTSCGCYQRERCKTANLQHGYRGTATYSTWVSMKARCKINGNWHNRNHGNRGIKVCKRWQKFKNFLEDMGERPSLDHWIERVNVNGNYTPKNCIWLHRSLQARNHQKALWFKIGKKKLRLIEWCEYYKVPYHRTWDRVYKQGWDIKRALTEKVHTQKIRD